MLKVECERCEGWGLVGENWNECPDCLGAGWVELGNLQEGEGEKTGTEGLISLLGTNTPGMELLKFVGALAALERGNLVQRIGGESMEEFTRNCYRHVENLGLAWNGEALRWEVREGEQPKG